MKVVSEFSFPVTRVTTKRAERTVSMIAGVPTALSPLVQRIVAPNPGVMTGPGTNTYLVGTNQIAVIDPGPADDSHIEAILDTAGDRIRWILCTHTHLDHAPGATPLRERTGAEVLAFGPRDELEVDRELRDGDVVEGDCFRITALHTPGHASNHLCYLLEEESLLFSGDHVMNGSTVVIAPPDGDMADYLAQLERVSEMPIETIAPGHGDLVSDPSALLGQYLTHRRAREGAIGAAMTKRGSATIEELVKDVYTDVAPALHPIAQFSVWAHLEKLAKEGIVAGAGLDGTWQVL